MAWSKTLVSLGGIFAFGMVSVAFGQIHGLSASNQLGSEDICGCPKTNSHS